MHDQGLLSQVVLYLRARYAQAAVCDSIREATKRRHICSKSQMAQF